MVNNTQSITSTPNPLSGDIDFRSETVESLLQPLITQLNALTMTGVTNTSISNSNSSNNMNGKKGSSQRAHFLVESVVESIENFLALGNEIAQENPEIHQDLMQAIENVRTTGNLMADTSRDFANDPLTPQKRLIMVKSSRDLLNSISRLLSLADMIDVNLLLRLIQIVQQDLYNMKNSSNQDELAQHFKSFGRNIIDLTNLAWKRQLDTRDVKIRDELAAARATLKKSSLKLFTSSKVNFNKLINKI
jgi:catenin alpha